MRACCIGNFIYENSVLKRILFEEGTIEIENGDINMHHYNYFIKDHLGNTRVACKPDFNTDGSLKTTPADIVRSDYYPFGMLHGGNDTQPDFDDNKYLYNGKELQTDIGWYDYGARFYDPSIARFMSVDAMAEERSWLTPYNYVQNNPIRRIDPDGNLDTRFEDEDGNFLHETKDGVDETVVIDNDKVDQFNETVEEYGNSILYNPQAEKKRTIDLSSNYMKEGQAMWYQQDKQGNISNLGFGTPKTHTVVQVGITGGYYLYGGGLISTGITFDDSGNVGGYLSSGLGAGFDLTGGIEVNVSKSIASDFTIESTEGYGLMYNGGVGIFDAAGGGPISGSTWYTTASFGISASPLPVGASVSFEANVVKPFFNIKKLK